MVKERDETGTCSWISKGNYLILHKILQENISGNVEKTGEKINIVKDKDRNIPMSAGQKYSQNIIWR